MKTEEINTIKSIIEDMEEEINGVTEYGDEDIGIWEVQRWIEILKKLV